MATIDPNDFRKPSRGKGQVVVVAAKKSKADELCQLVLEGIVRDILYPRADREDFMWNEDVKACQGFYINIEVRRGRVYKTKKR